MADGNTKVTSNDIRGALKLRYPGQSHALLFEVAPSTGGGTRYADAIAVGLWPSHGHNIEGVEIKVSRSDFLSEMKKPEKSQPVFQYCDRWWLACPKGMVAPEELPVTWGLLELCGETLRQKIKAPKLTPAPISIGFLASLVRRHAGMDDEMAANALDKRMAGYAERTKQELAAEAERRIHARIKEVERATAMIEQINVSTGIDLTRWEYQHDDRLIKAIKLVMELDGRWDGIAGLRKSLAEAVDKIDSSGLLQPVEDIQSTDVRSARG